MIKVIPIALSCLSTVAIVGCGGAPRAVTWPEARPWGADLPSYRAPRHPIPTDEDARAFAEPGGQLTQHDAFAAALLHNRDLATFAWDVRIREARALQASLPPNPEIELELEEFGGTGDASAFDAAETTALFSQLIELGQKRRKRTRLAELNQDLAAWEYETARVRVLTSVARAFIATLVLQQQTELANRNQALAREAYDTIDKRVAAGAAASLDRTNASVVVARAGIELQRRRRALASARVDLASTWGSREPAFQRVDGDLTQLKTLPTLEVLSSLIDQNPQIARWTVEMTQRQARIDLDRAGAMPDVTVGVGAKYLGESEDTAAVVQLSMPLPIFDRNQGAVLESRYALAKARAARRAAELRVGTALGRAWRRLAAAHEEVTALQADVLPAARRAFEDTNVAYRQGKVGYLSVIDAQRTFFDTRGQVVGALGAYHQAVVDVEGLIGRRLSTLDEPRPNETQSTGDQP